MTKEEKVTKVLIELGVPANVKGYRYTRDAVLFVAKEGMDSSVTKDIYPYVAKKYNSEGTRVERAIRHAVTIILDRGNWKLAYELFGTTEKLTNSAFIKGLADLVQRSKDLEE